MSGFTNERILITGGVRSSKSRTAEQRLVQSEHVLYIATVRCFDSEMERRIALQRQSRPAHWITAEADSGLGRMPAQHPDADVLLDCVENV